MASRVGIWYLVLCLWCLSALSLNGVRAQEAEAEAEAESKEHVLTLDHSNFHDTVSKHPFIVVEFYAPWCGHCKNLAPEYEKAASLLSSHDPPIVLAKVDANEESNKALATEYEVKGFPTIKIMRNGGKDIQDYKGPREAEGIVDYLKKQNGPASVEIKSADDGSNLIVDKKIVVVGVFPKFSGEEYEKYFAFAEKLRSSGSYEFAHTKDVKFLPRGDTSVSGPLIRLLKPFDELFVDSTVFDIDALTKFVDESSVPTVTEFNNDPTNHPFVSKFFEGPNAKAMMFMNVSSEGAEAFTSKYREVAEQYKNKGISFLLGDLEASQGAFQYFGLNIDQVPLIVIQTEDGKKYLNANVEPAQIASWIKEFQEGNVKPFKKSEPIPEQNNEPVKVVVAETLQDIVYNSGKNVFLKFHAPWCGHCKNLAPILEEVAVSFENDTDVIIAKLDATANDIDNKEFDIKGYPTLYFRSASGTLTEYTGGRTKDEIISFIETNRDKSEKQDVKEAETQESVKDEL